MGYEQEEDIAPQKKENTHYDKWSVILIILMHRLDLLKEYKMSQVT